MDVRTDNVNYKVASTLKDFDFFLFRLKSNHGLLFMIPNEMIMSSNAVISQILEYIIRILYKLRK